MRRNWWNRKLIFVWVLLITAGLVYSIHLLEPPVEDFCSGLGYLPSNRATTSVHAINVVVEPLLGRHQAYAIFQLRSEKCPPGKRVVLTVVGAGKYCETVNPIGQGFEGIEAASGYYLSRHYIRTRTALWLTVRGLSAQLKQLQSWMLTYAE